MNTRLGIGLLGILSIQVGIAIASASELRWVEIEAFNKEQRTAIVNAGIDIEEIRSSSVWALVDAPRLKTLDQLNLKVLGNYDSSVWINDFPDRDARFHNYTELLTELRVLQRKHPDISSLMSIGKSIEGRDLWAFHINTALVAHERSASGKPGIVYMGNHHAREHLSLEIPLMWAQYLLENRKDSRVSALLNSRDIWIIPMVNPDGAEYDIASNRYKMWRKNRRPNANGTYGVDLNRNYSFMWGTGGSSTDPSSDLYMGAKPFSEPETQAIRNFVQARPNLKVLLTFHTFSELILYPWGHSYDGIPNQKDKQVFEQMAQKMAKWNGYTPEPASDLYIVSGDTVDWAYGTVGIFGFTFELSPRWSGDGGFYPGAGVIDRVFQANLEPCLYLLEMAGDPYRALEL